VLLTHYHLDHVQGLFPLRWGVGAPIPVYGPPDRMVERQGRYPQALQLKHHKRRDGMAEVEQAGVLAPGSCAGAVSAALGRGRADPGLRPAGRRRLRRSARLQQITEGELRMVERQGRYPQALQLKHHKRRDGMTITWIMCRGCFRCAGAWARRSRSTARRTTPAATIR
jgi:ribonuclease BN (tRNA processing enzyme)